MVVPRWEDEHLSGLLASLGLPNDHYLGPIKEKICGKFLCICWTVAVLGDTKEGKSRKTPKAGAHLQLMALLHPPNDRDDKLINKRAACSKAM